PRFGDGLRPGSYKIGAWYDTSTADDVVDDVNGDPMALTGLPPRRRDGRYGAYINFEQQLTENLSAFLNAVVADKRTATTDRQVAAGLIYAGPFSARPDDDIGFAAGTTHVNRRVADVEDLQDVPKQTSEYAFELYYTIRPLTGFYPRPNLQYVIDPGGTSKNDDVVVFGLKMGADF